MLAGEMAVAQRDFENGMPPRLPPPAAAGLPQLQGKKEQWSQPPLQCAMGDTLTLCAAAGNSIYRLCHAAPASLRRWPQGEGKTPLGRFRGENIIHEFLWSDMNCRGAAGVPLLPFKRWRSRPDQRGSRCYSRCYSRTVAEPEIAEEVDRRVPFAKHERCGIWTARTHMRPCSSSKAALPWPSAAASLAVKEEITANILGSRRFCHVKLLKLM